MATDDEIIAEANMHLDRLVEMVRGRIEKNPNFSVPDLVDKLCTAPPGTPTDRHISTLAWSLGLSLFRQALGGPG